METSANAYLFYWSYINIIVQPCLTDENVCPRTKSLIIDGKARLYNETVCCDNYEMRAGKCVECKLGFYRPVDYTPEQCLPCMEDSYGKKCAYTCTCASTDRCNSMTGGCVPKSVANEDVTTHVDNTAVSFTSSTNLSIDDKETLINNSWLILDYRYVTAGGVSLIIICVCASFVLVKKRSIMSDIGISIPVNTLHNPLSNQAVQAVALNLLYHDYEEIDETILNDAPEFRIIQIEENDSDSTEDFQGKPSEDAEGYLNPYHSLVYPLSKCEFITVKSTRKSGSSYSDQNHYDCLILSKRIGCLTTKSMSHVTIVKTTENCNLHTSASRVTI